MAVGSRPRYNFTKKNLFNSKTGVLPFIHKKTHKAKFPEKTKKIMKKKDVLLITKKVVCHMLLENVIPAVKCN